MKSPKKTLKGVPAVERVFRTCADCGGQMVGTRQSYRYKECGLSSVTLVNVMVFECECGARVPELPAIENLHHMIAIDLLQKESLLSGEEVRFLRKMAGLSQSELAQIIGVHVTRPSKWESGGEPIGKESDRVLRSCCLFGMAQQHLNDSDPVAATLAAAKVIQQLDVKEVFKRIKSTMEGSKKIEVANSHPETGDPWLLPNAPPMVPLVQ